MGRARRRPCCSESKREKGRASVGPLSIGLAGSRLAFAWEEAKTRKRERERGGKVCEGREREREKYPFFAGSFGKIGDKKDWVRKTYLRGEERGREIKSVRRSGTKRETNNGQKRSIGFGQTKEIFPRQRGPKKRGNNAKERRYWNKRRRKTEKDVEEWECLGREIEKKKTIFWSSLFRFLLWFHCIFKSFQKHDFTATATAAASTTTNDNSIHISTKLFVKAVRRPFTHELYCFFEVTTLVSSKVSVKVVISSKTKAKHMHKGPFK